MKRMEGKISEGRKSGVKSDNLEDKPAPCRLRRGIDGTNAVELWKLGAF